jgi:hypothetical protein
MIDKIIETDIWRECNQEIRLEEMAITEYFDECMD